jgi:hypothetical protein
MLVKIGDKWVDPSDVSLINPLTSSVEILIKSQPNLGFVKVGSFTFEEDSNKKADEFASIVNNALGQSYGGEETKEEPAAVLQS